jgi:hypothetical protein
LSSAPPMGAIPSAFTRKVYFLLGEVSKPDR